MNITRLLMQKPAILVLTCLTFYSCKTEEVYFNVTEPTPVTIPSYVKKVGIINRTIDDALTAKGPLLDKECSNECIRGLRDALMQNNTFQNVVFLDSVKIKNTFPGTFPSPLSWDKIEEICRLNNVDVLFVLELFHTGTRINLAASPVVLISPTVGTTVNTGWRIYDPQNRILLDEYPIAEDLTFAGGGLNPFDETSALMNHKEAVMGVSYHIGQCYAGRTFPYTIRVCREFYIKGSINFKIARRMADAGDWSKAADLWNKETTNPKLKIVARAYYNMAIISELNGDVDGAITWAKKAYETGGKRLALLYLNNLQNRKAQNDLLKLQAHTQ